jgi:hypothetical protein
MVHRRAVAAENRLLGDAHGVWVPGVVDDAQAQPLTEYPWRTLAFATLNGIVAFAVCPPLDHTMRMLWSEDASSQSEAEHA